MTTISLAKIRTDGGTQPRAAIDHETVADYAEFMRQGAVFPPVVVFYDGAEYWLADGFHRLNAALTAGMEVLACDVQQGTREDARWFSFSANKSNGLRRTNEDKQRAVKAALAHPQSSGMSDSSIARHIGVHHDTVSEWRKKLSPLSESASETNSPPLERPEYGALHVDVPQTRADAIFPKDAAYRQGCISEVPHVRVSGPYLPGLASRAPYGRARQIPGVRAAEGHLREAPRSRTRKEGSTSSP